MEKTKIVVKIGINPDVKEVLTGENLTVRRSDGVVQIIDGDENIGEFANPIYWRYVDYSKPDRLHTVESVLVIIQGILDDGQVNADIRLEKIQKLMYDIPEINYQIKALKATIQKIDALIDNTKFIEDAESPLVKAIHILVNSEIHRLQLINEPDKDLLLLNLGYLDTFVDRLAPGMDTETLAWCIYAVKQFAEHKLVPGGPVNPNDPEWPWEKFKDSFRPAKVLEP